ncbi:hypothetical protein QBC47DRAFT_48118 [Echria macrotheca]|uniref:AB hydrolase-1 domain-containing protein n=1 Tax=Echria macrotheca TaxID=438768 RepID=A0AAJ0FA47_9PEZI|nr:hypothetical protein QBC47DRAFT_48118 [Echria macrotheca]
MAAKFEFVVLYEPKNFDADVLVDIVFVHGILGDYESTWTHQESKILWPRDLLPIDFPRARIASLNYSPNFDDFFPAESAVGATSGLDRLSSGLCEALERFRQTAPKATNRPIILVAHSLGGLICTKAILETPVEGLAGVIFFGTPFVQEPEEWRPLASRFAKLVGLDDCGTLPESALTSLVDIVDDFESMIEREILDPSGLLFLSETEICKPLEGPVLEGGDAVPFGDIGDSVEEAGVDHISISRFDTPDREGYSMVLRKLIQITRGSQRPSELIDVTWTPWMKRVRAREPRFAL